MDVPGLCPWIPGPPVNMIRLNKLQLSLIILNYFIAINVAKDYGFCVKLSQDNNHMNI